VDVVEPRQIQMDLAPESFEPAAGIPHAIAQQRARDAIDRA